MKLLWLSLILLLTLGFGFSGCGGGGDSSTPSSDEEQTMSGVFIDAPVEGLSYECSSGLSGTTDTDGRFTCAIGDTITFDIGGLILGSCLVQDVITPLHLYLEEVNKEKAYNVVQILHSLDDDGNPDNNIKLSLGVSLGDIDIQADSNSFQNAIASALASAGLTPYNREEAKAKMFSYISTHSANNYGLSVNISDELELLETLMCSNAQKLEIGECKAKNCKDDAYNCPACSVDEELIYETNGNGSCTKKSCETGFNLSNGQCVADEVEVPVAEVFSLSSSSFTDGGVIPTTYACIDNGGQNSSPQLSWNTPPEGTSSVAIIMDDETSPCGTGDSACVHWGVFNIPNDILSLSGNIDTSTIQDISEGYTYNNTSGYNGPCPPARHTYKVTIYALSSEMPNISKADTATTGIRRSQFESQYGDYILDSNTISATFTP